MKNINKIKKITALCLALLMLMLTACSKTPVGEEPATGDESSAPLITYTDTTQTVTKNENVYVNLNSDGSVKKITVSDWLHADRAEVKVVDSTTLKDFVVTRGQAASVSADGKLTWHMTTSDVYYEGASDKQLPIDVSIKYFLDEQEMTPADLKGKSGNFRMEITMKNNIVQEIEADGVKYTMYAPLAMVGGFMLPYENFSNIEVTNCISVGGGSFEAIVMTGAPGLNESLQLDKLNISGFEDFSFPSTFTIKATVTDFTLGDAYFAAMPLSALNMDIAMPKTLEDAKNVLNEVKNVSNLLAQIDPNQVVAEFMKDTNKIKEMLDIMQKGLKVYNENKKMLETMTTLLTPENITTLSNFITKLEGEDMQSLMNVMSNVPALKSVLGSLMDISEDLDEITPLLNQFSAALEDPEVAASMEKLPETLATLSELMTYLNENKELLDVLTKLTEADNLNSLTAALDTMASNSSALGETDITELPEEAETLIKKMQSWLNAGYRIYTSAPEYMQTSCMFIYKTDPIA
ncbi:MAG: hypothetical protein IKW03_02050 [Clostridia bacterium]|nr:hypothetical protein [Clostridia bacterium]